MDIRKCLFLLFYLIFPLFSFAATLKDDAYELEITYRREQKEEEPRKLHLKLNASGLQPIRLFYSKDKIHKEDASQFIQVRIQDVRSLTFVGSETNQPLLETVIVSDQGAILMGYIETENSLISASVNSLGLFKSIEQVLFVTDEEEDKEDSTNYCLEYAKEYVWKGIQESDFVRYHVSELRPMKATEDPEDQKTRLEPYEYEMIYKVVKVNEGSLTQDSVDIEITTPETVEPLRKTLSWKEYPSFKVKKVLPMKKTTSEFVTVRDLAQRKSITTQTFELEVEDETGETLVLSLDPSLFPLVYLNGINASVRVRNQKDEVMQAVVETSRFKFDQGKEELAHLTPAQQEVLATQVMTYSSDFFTTLKDNKLTKETIDQFIAMDELFIALDGFPQSFEAERTLENIIEEMEQTIDQRFNTLENDLSLCLEQLANMDHDLAVLNGELARDPNSTEAKKKIAQLTFLRRDWVSKYEMLERLKAADRERLKQEQRRLYTEGFNREQQSRRNVLAYEVTRFFQDEIASGVTWDQVMQASQFTLLSPTHALISFLNSSVKIHLKLHTSQWKICAIVDSRPN
ncbi:MAG: hypothetical protein HYY61_05900 [Deltaproteobacteria bacterium]|nr:hypothetical protein [Deltaproteobacteria bacterium]